MSPLRVGIVGCGNISGIYLENLGKFKATEVVAVADLDLDRAKTVAEKYGVANALSTDALLAHPDVDLVLNLTIPAVHGAIAQAAVDAGKHVYNEKPLAVERAEAKQMLATAKAKGLRVGCAPDTFMGAGIQTCRQLLDEGAIGQIVGAQCSMMSFGPESWHPSPDFFYKRGAGPMFDMGPYYLTALVNLVGGVKRVTASTRITHAQREIGSEPLKGTMIQVETPTHIVGLLDFENGAVGEITTSFDSGFGKVPNISIYGSEGTLIVPDPNTFGAGIQIITRKESEWREVPLTHGFAENSRGLGVLDIALAIAENRPHRASGDLAFHVLDIMHAFHDASDASRHIDMDSTVARPEPMAPTQFADQI